MVADPHYDLCEKAGFRGQSVGIEVLHGARSVSFIYWVSHLAILCSRPVRSQCSCAKRAAMPELTRACMAQSQIVFSQVGHHFTQFPPLPWDDFPSIAEVDRIATLGDRVLRNLQITQCYHELALALAKRTSTHANWCNFATWASKQAGEHNPEGGP